MNTATATLLCGIVWSDSTLRWYREVKDGR